MNLGLAEILVVLVVLAIMVGGVATIVLAAMSGGRRAAERERHVGSHAGTGP